MDCFDLAIAGGGAAGLFGAAVAAGRGLSVLLLERNERCGKKIAITGKGRCNLTNTRDWGEFSEHIHPSPNFFKSAFFGMSNRDTMAFFEQIGLPLTVERGQRVFPASMRAQDVTDVLLARLRQLGVSVCTGWRVVGASKVEYGACAPVFKVEAKCSASGSLRVFTARNLLLTTGGLSYPATGSTGDGYVLAESFGHRIVPCFPSLTALVPLNYDISLSGVSLKNVELSLYVNGNCVQTEFGEMDFTDDGIEGAAAIRLSRRAVAALDGKQKVFVSFDLKPALSCEQLRLRIIREAAAGTSVARGGTAGLKTLLKRLLPGALVAPFMRANKDLSYENLPERLKAWRFAIVSYVGYRRCVVTAGGVDLAGISPKTMGSKLVDGLYFAGEILNLDGDTGGYNLQIAFSTAALAAKSISGRE